MEKFFCGNGGIARRELARLRAMVPYGWKTQLQKDENDLASPIHRQLAEPRTTPRVTKRRDFNFNTYNCNLNFTLVLLIYVVRRGTIPIGIHPPGRLILHLDSWKIYAEMRLGYPCKASTGAHFRQRWNRHFYKII